MEYLSNLLQRFSHNKWFNEDSNQRCKDIPGLVDIMNLLTFDIPWLSNNKTLKFIK